MCRLKAINDRYDENKIFFMHIKVAIILRSTTYYSSKMSFNFAFAFFCALAGLAAAENDWYIVNGTNAANGVAPYQVGLFGEGSNDIQCGGTFINEKTVLTAAHCFSG